MEGMSQNNLNQAITDREVSECEILAPETLFLRAKGCHTHIQSIMLIIVPANSNKTPETTFVLISSN